jgi:hypothetical protein
MIAAIENLLFLLLVAVAALFQLLAKKAAKTSRSETRPTSAPIPRTPPQISRTPKGSDEDRIRKLLEALGQPPTSKPPPPVVPRTDIPPHPLAPVQPPLSPLSQLKRETPRKREVVPRENVPPFTITRAEKIVPPKIMGAPAFEVHEGPSSIAPPPVISAVAGVTQTVVKTHELRTDVIALLASISGLRDAIILREILGPPRGLRSTDSL